jgi:hypothetical protein
LDIDSLVSKTFRHDSPAGGQLNRSTDIQTTPYYFISYSRQEVTFVDSFTRELEKHGVRTWVDFRNLVPGHSWQEQLDAGVANADAVLLVVSKSSMASSAVMDEVKKSIAASKRIVMILFEPCPIHSHLKGREWVDLTRDFSSAIQQLKSILAQPEGKMTTSPPEKYVREKQKLSCLGLLISPLLALAYIGRSLIFGAGYLPKGVKRFFFLSMLLTLLSFLALVVSMTTANSGANSVLENVSVVAIFFIYFPAAWNFLQFPVRVRFRRHNAEKLRNAIFGLFAITLVPLLINLGGLLGISGLKVDHAALWLAGITLFGCYYLYRVLTSDAFYRWAGPAGTLIAPPRPDLTKHLNADQGDTKVAIESAPQDHAYALELKDSILKAGFKYTDNLNEAKIVLTLLSAYQNNSQCDPQNKYVFPILLQSSRDIGDGEKNEFSQLQWIDLRFGKVSMDAVAHLLDEPENLLRVLGIVPIRTSILPNGVNYLVSLISFVLTYAVIVTFFQAWFNLKPNSDTGIAAGLGMRDFLAILFVLGLYLFRRYITKRRFWLLKRRVQNFYKSGISDPILSKIIPPMERRRLFLDLENRLNAKLGRVGLSYPWMLVFAVLLAALATGAFWDLNIAYIPAWLIPLFMLMKPVRLWLPTRVKSP